MKALKSLLALFLFVGIIYSANAQKELAPYYKLGAFQGSMTDAVAKVNTALNDAGFEIVGTYNPEKNANLTVLAYTSQQLQNICLQKKDRGMLAAVLKVGFMQKNGKVEISMLNPDYLFNAYLQDDYEKNATALHGISTKAVNALQKFGVKASPFGGSIELDDLREYQYMWGMEEFTDPVKLKVFKSFDEGASTIEQNLASQKGNCKLVYKLVRKENSIAVYGIALNNSEEGEAFFLPIIGESHLAALPYEIILQGNTATMLHGRYRIALHWPELTMGTFTKIMATPGDVESFFEGLCE